jgi:L-alanine-DL-glutamate epimerase-like enolase superfamily enzyme
MAIDPRARIVRVRKALLRGRRPRVVGHNARIGTHGDTVTEQVVEVFCESGHTGTGCCSVDERQARELLGAPLGELFALPDGAGERGAPLDWPLWDLTARMAGLPLYRLVGDRGSREVEMYDSSLYIDDLGLDDRSTATLFQEEVADGLARGFRNFKVKIGRGARWMPAQEGLRRDELVARTVREAAGPGAKILVDANMGNTLNTAIEILHRTRDVGLYWFEEPFAEDPPINRALKDYIESEGLGVLVADGEYHPPPMFLDMVREGLIDVVQYDLRRCGFSFWVRQASVIEAMGGLCAPHCWGSIIDRFFSAHLAAAIPNYSLLEADTAETPWLLAEAWKISDGRLLVPEIPGAGFAVDPEAFERAVREPGGFDLRL